MQSKYEVTIVVTRKLTIPIEANSEDEALKIIASEYFDNRHVLTDEDYDTVSTEFSCEQINNDMRIHMSEYD